MTSLPSRIIAIDSTIPPRMSPGRARDARTPPLKRETQGAELSDRSTANRWHQLSQVAHPGSEITVSNGRWARPRGWAGRRSASIARQSRACRSEPLRSGRVRRVRFRRRRASRSERRSRTFPRISTSRGDVSTRRSTRGTIEKKSGSLSDSQFSATPCVIATETRGAPPAPPGSSSASLSARAQRRCYAPGDLGGLDALRAAVEERPAQILLERAETLADSAGVTPISSAAAVMLRSRATASTALSALRCESFMSL